MGGILFHSYFYYIFAQLSNVLLQKTKQEHGWLDSKLILPNRNSRELCHPNFRKQTLRGAQLQSNIFLNSNIHHKGSSGLILTMFEAAHTKGSIVRRVLYKNFSEETSYFFSRVLQNHEVSGLYRSGENLKFFRRTCGRGNSKLYESKF